MIPVPGDVIEALRLHLQVACPRAQRGWESVKEEEDAITGDFFGNLRTDWTATGKYSWRFSYNKFRGRGRGALEKEIGADGLITVQYLDPEEGKTYYKSLVFQAKKQNGRIKPSQLETMRRHFPGGSAVVIYGPSGYTAYEHTPLGMMRLCDMIAFNFLNCTIGTEGLHYDSRLGQMILPNAPALSGGIERLLIEIKKD